MSRIVTITFNPCVDKSISVPKLVPEKKMYCSSSPHLDPGGGGINVARAISRLGGSVTAVYPAGGYHGGLLTHLLEGEQVPVMPVAIKNDTRENWIVLDESHNKQYRFITPGPVLTEEEWNQCLFALESIESPEFIVISGSMPEVFPENIFEKIGCIAARNNAKLIVDTSGDGLKQAMKQEVYLIKPNINELASLIIAFNLGSHSVNDAAREIVMKGYCEILIVSLGAEGALLVTRDTMASFKPPPVNKISSVGAGDSLVAGIVQSLVQQKSLEEAVKYGIACGTATTMKPGTALFERDDVEHLYSIIQETNASDENHHSP